MLRLVSADSDAGYSLLQIVKRFGFIMDQEELCFTRFVIEGVSVVEFAQALIEHVRLLRQHYPMNLCASYRVVQLACLTDDGCA